MAGHVVEKLDPPSFIGTGNSALLHIRGDGRQPKGYGQKYKQDSAGECTIASM
ncbi:MAG: hypothetical protein VCD34_11780 [Planctomycetota bacterium]